MVAEVLEKGWSVIDSELPVQEYVNEIISCKQHKYLIKTHTLTPGKQSTARISLSQLYGLNELPFHTDGAQYEIPPRYIILNSIDLDPNVARTMLIDSYSILKNEDNLAYNSVFSIRGNGFRELTPLINKRDFSLPMFRYNPIIMDSIIKSKKIRLESLIQQSTPILIEWKPKRSIIIDNWRMLHSRERISHMNQVRVIKRTEIYLKIK